MISFTKTKLLPDLPEIAIGAIHSVEDGKFRMQLTQITSIALAELVWGTGSKIKYDRLHAEASRRGAPLPGGKRSHALRTPITINLDDVADPSVTKTA